MTGRLGGGAKSRLVTLDDIREAAETIAGVARRTPLLAEEPTSAGGSPDLRFKCENLQLGGAFKLRGAYNFVAHLPSESRARGVVTYSSGNHGRAVALAAGQFGIPALVVVPVDVPRVKVQAIRALGAEVVEEGRTSLERQERAEEIAAKRDLTIVPPFDHPRIIAGQGTVGLEIVEDWPEVERVVVPVGGGGLLAGVSAAVRALVPGARIFGVEPRGAAAMRRSLEAGAPTRLESVETVADGLKPVWTGDLTFEHVQALVDDVVVVDDEAILRSLTWVAEQLKLVVEPSGAAALAALRTSTLPPDEAPTAVVLSGGNVDPANWSHWLDAYGNGAADGR